jgi:hypothetical protein
MTQKRGVSKETIKLLVAILVVVSMINIIAMVSYSPTPLYLVTGRQAQAQATATLVLLEPHSDPTTEPPSGGGGGGGGRPLCQNECTLGVVACASNGDRIRCVTDADSDSCTEYTVDACQALTFCLNGQCVPECQENWICDEWSACTATDDGGEKDGKQTRNCIDYHGCGTEEQKPEIRRSCTLPVGEEPTGLGQYKFKFPDYFKSLADELGGLGAAKGASLVAGLMAIVTLMLASSVFFQPQMANFWLFSKIQGEQGLINVGKYAKADMFHIKNIEGHYKGTKFDNLKRFHRKIQHDYHETRRDISRYHEKLARKHGETAKANHFKKQSEKHERLVKKFSK